MDEIEEQIGRLYGGIVVKVNNEILLEPTCCGDIGNLQGWENIFEAATNQWHQLWIGHPWIFYKRENGFICFSDYTNSNLEDFTNIKAVIKLSETGLSNELTKIRKQQNDFEEKIHKILDKMGFKNGAIISKLMTGNFSVI